MRPFSNFAKRLSRLFGTRPNADTLGRSAVLVTYRLAAPSSSSTAEAIIANKMRSMVVKHGGRRRAALMHEERDDH